MSIHDDSFIEGWTKLFAEVHKYGCKLLPQLFHPAYMAFPMPGTPQLIAPSNVGPYYAKAAPRAVTVEELKVIIRQFGEAAYRVKQAGGDGVEIHAAHAHGLLGGFLTPLYNKRCDEYGGDINGRLKLTLEVIEEVRKTCGEDFIIQVRISGDEYSDGGLNLTDMIYVSKQLEKAGVDILHVSGGNTVKRASSMPAPGTKQGSHTDLSVEIKKYVNIPVVTVGRITDAWVADEIIANGIADAAFGPSDAGSVTPVSGYGSGECRGTGPKGSGSLSNHHGRYPKNQPPGLDSGTGADGSGRRVAGIYGSVVCIAPGGCDDGAGGCAAGDSPRQK
jgi:2,4-dienoyl-CoA reductase-like NADH-dependent reductase (Old Yellow Enzyme family)